MQSNSREIAMPHAKGLVNSFSTLFGNNLKQVQVFLKEES